MSYVLKLNDEQLASCPVWNPRLFGDLSGASFPRQVPPDFVWEYEGYWLGWEEDPVPVPPTPEEIAARQAAENEQLRAEAYRFEADPLFFKWQRGEIEKEVWLDKVNEIKARYPE